MLRFDHAYYEASYEVIFRSFWWFERGLKSTPIYMPYLQNSIKWFIQFSFECPEAQV